MSELIRVYITDDHQIVRRGIRQLLSTEAGIEVVGEASNGKDAVADMDKLKPDIVLMDLVMPVMDGIEAIRQIKAGHPSIQILVLTSFATDDKVFPAIKAGALGYLIKDTSPEELRLKVTAMPTCKRARGVPFASAIRRPNTKLAVIDAIITPT
jgi:NarL family two-component system response regulator LiaR